MLDFQLELFQCRDYEAVEMTDVTRATLLPWLASLRDALTITADRPEGQPLKVSATLSLIYVEYYVACIETQKVQHGFLYILSESRAKLEKKGGGH